MIDEHKLQAARELGHSAAQDLETLHDGGIGLDDLALAMVDALERKMNSFDLALALRDHFQKVVDAEGGAPPEPTGRDLLDRAVDRLQQEAVQGYARKAMRNDGA